MQYSAEDIKNEIKLKGNTNDISDSGLPDGKKVFAVGDSHTIFFYNSMKIKEHWGFMSLIPLTVYTLLENGMDITKVGDTLGGGHERYNIGEGDWVLFYYGFNDVQKNVKTYGADNWQTMVTDLFSRYLDLLLNYKTVDKINPIVCCIYPNPRYLATGQNPSGTYEERKTYAEFVNNYLRTECVERKLPFLDIYSHITDDAGFIRQDMTTDNVHLDFDNADLRTFVEGKIFELISPPPS